MHHFAYRGGILHAEGVDLRRIAGEVGTPFYCYSSATLEHHYRVFDGAFDGCDRMICYSVKANSNLAVLKLLAGLGAGMDVVSEGELRRARAVGVPGERLYAAWADEELLREWLRDTRFTVRKATPSRSMRITWGDGTDVDVYFYAKGEEKGQVTVEHRKLPDPDSEESMRAFWRDRFAVLKALLERGD